MTDASVTCRACGTVATGASRFCPSCGGSLIAAPPAASAADPWVGKLVQGRFRLLEKLGAGGMGVVYKAEQVAMRRPVALKILHPSLVQDTEVVTRFENEAAACSKLTHPNTITVHDFGQAEDGTLFIAMEFISGSSLEQVLRTGGALPWRRAVAVALQICASLTEAHAHGIVHRDLKPGNIMLFDRPGTTDTVKVLDFGIAKICEGVGGIDQRQALTRTGMVFGTPQYMSPEQIKGEKVGPRSDLYAVGVILYEMLTGDLPFSAETPMGMLTKHLLEMPRPMRQALPGLQMPPVLEEAVMKAMAKGVDERHASMEALAQQLRPCLEEESIPPVEPAAPITGPRSREREAYPTPAATPAAIAATRVAPTDPGIRPAAPAGRRRLVFSLVGAVFLCAVGVGAFTLVSHSSGASPGAATPATVVPPGPSAALPSTGPAPIAPVRPATGLPTEADAACTFHGVDHAAGVARLLGERAGGLRGCAGDGPVTIRYRVSGDPGRVAGIEAEPDSAEACATGVLAAIEHPADAAGRVEVRVTVRDGRCSGEIAWSRAAGGGRARAPGKKDEVLPR